MPSPTSSPGLRDNHTRGTVAEFLTEKIQDGSRLSVVSAYFTIYAYDAMKQVLDRIDHLDFLFGEPSFVNRLDPSKAEKRSFVMSHYDGLIRKALASIEHTCQRRAASSLLASRGAVLPSAAETPTARGNDVDLVTWLVIPDGKTD